MLRKWCRRDFIKKKQQWALNLICTWKECDSVSSWWALSSSSSSDIRHYLTPGPQDPQDQVLPSPLGSGHPLSSQPWSCGRLEEEPFLNLLRWGQNFLSIHVAPAVTPPHHQQNSSHSLLSWAPWEKVFSPEDISLLFLITISQMKMPFSSIIRVYKWNAGVRWALLTPSCPLGASPSRTRTRIL